MIETVIYCEILYLKADLKLAFPLQKNPPRPVAEDILDIFYTGKFLIIICVLNCGTYINTVAAWA